MSPGARLDLPNLPAGWCCYIVVRSDGMYDCGISSNLSQEIQRNSLNNGSGSPAGEGPIALVWYEPARDRHGATVRQQKIQAWNAGQNHRRARKCVPFEGAGKNVWIPLASSHSAAK